MIRDEPEGKRAGVGRDDPSHRSPQFTFSSRPSYQAVKAPLNCNDTGARYWD